MKCISDNREILYSLVPEIGSTTPTKQSLRSRMMEKFGYGKSPAANSSNPIPIEEPSVSCKMTSNNQQESAGSSSSPKEDPFLGSTHTVWKFKDFSATQILREILFLFF